jgi:hypothetical protein
MVSLNERYCSTNYLEIEDKVDALIKEIDKPKNKIQDKQDSIESCFVVNVSLFAPVGAIYMVIGLIYSHFLIYVIGVLFLFWGTISYSIISIRDKIKKTKKFKMID